MTVVGAGGIRFIKISTTVQFGRQLRKLDPPLQARVQEKVSKLLEDPIPSGIDFEKLKGYSSPDIYTIHVDGNYKVSLHIDAADSSCCVLRKVGNHDAIDRSP